MYTETKVASPAGIAWDVARIPAVLSVLAALALLSSPGKADWTFTVSSGSAYSFYTPIVIHQSGYPDLRIDGRCWTEPFADVPYYDLRLSGDVAGSRWEIELIHHKLYLQNRPPEVQRFQVTHGFNFITLNHCWSWQGFDLRAGAGMILTHPETEIRDKAFPENGDFLGLGFYPSGVGGQAGLDRRFRLNKRFDLVAEGKFTGAVARIPIADGTADISNLALHGLLGVMYRF
jgi:hypothetical protein